MGGLKKNHLLTLVLAITFVILLLAAQALSAADSLPNPRSVEVGPPLECGQIEAIMSDPENYTIIDTRSPSEFDDAHVVTAVNIPFDSLQYYENVLPADKNQPIVTYCRSGARATVLKMQLEERGYTDIVVIPGEQMDRSEAGKLGFRCGDAED